MYRIYPEVKIGENAFISDFVVIGVPCPASRVIRETRIGKNAIIRSHSVIYAGNQIGENFHTGHGVLIREKNEIGHNVSIGSHSVIEHHVRIRDNVRIHSQAFIPEFSVLEEGCWIGPNVVLTNTMHPLCPMARKCLKGPVIGRGAKVGANSTILPGITIGENSLVGAGSVVVKNVPRDCVVAGTPAQVIKVISQLKCSSGLMDQPYKEGGSGQDSISRLKSAVSQY